MLVVFLSIFGKAIIENILDKTIIKRAQQPIFISNESLSPKREQRIKQVDIIFAIFFLELLICISSNKVKRIIARIRNTIKFTQVKMMTQSSTFSNLMMPIPKNNIASEIIKGSTLANNLVVITPKQPNGIQGIVNIQINPNCKTSINQKKKPLLYRYQITKYNDTSLSRANKLQKTIKQTFSPAQKYLIVKNMLIILLEQNIRDNKSNFLLSQSQQ
ncbi:hypothetical protein ABPG74_017176 [Tetrahymena malaccensis]